MNQDTKPVKERILAIAEHLFIEPVQSDGRKTIQIAWIKNNGKGESFSVICFKNKAIVFNSHKNEIIMTQGKVATQDYLTKILKPFANTQVDLNPFFYALGQFREP